MIGQPTHRRILSALVCWAALASTAVLLGDEPSLPSSLAAWTTELRHTDLEVRRKSAIATRRAEKAIQQELLPVLIELLENEKDGQVRLAILDTMTDMGPAAEPAVPTLVAAMTTTHGGRRNEELHRDYRVALALASIGKPAVQGLQGLLAAEKANVRAEAAMALGRIGGPAASAVGGMLPLLADEETRVRREAAIALGRIGTPALDSLLEAAAHDEVSYRVGAMVAFGNFVTANGTAAESVVEGARDEAAAVRAAAVRALSIHPVSVAVQRELLLANLRHHDEEVRSAVVNQLAGDRDRLRDLEGDLAKLLVADHDGVAWHAAFLLQATGIESLPTLLSALRSTDSRVEQVAGAMALLGVTAVDALLEATGDAEPRVRQGAALALGQIRPLKERTVLRLGAGLNDREAPVQAAFLKAIGYLGPRAREVVPDVRLKLRDPAPELRMQAIEILFDSAPRDAQLLDDLRSMLDDSHVEVQRQAINAIRSLGPIGRSALELVIQKLESPDADVRAAAAAMIGSHGAGAAEAVPALRSLLSEPAAEQRIIGAETLGQIGAASQPAFEELIELLDDETPGVRLAVVATLGNLQLEAERLRPHLAGALRDEESDVRRAAFRGIRRFGRQGSIFVPDLIRLAADESQARYLGRTLARYERYGTAAQSIPELIELLGHESDAVQLWAVKFLGLAGSQAEGALVELQSLADHANEEVRTQAKLAIASIQGIPPAIETGSEDKSR